ADRVVRCCFGSGEDDVPLARPGADGLLVTRERRMRQSTPRIRPRPVRNSTRERTAATAAAPAEHFLTGPDDGAETVVHREQPRSRQPPPAVGPRVVREPCALSTDELI